ncbi:MAG: DUF1585 domain-containing protein [Myxococcota bacterium]|nr:DUF1585 domain-containing protein [Myxococcota bacterium]
MTPFLYITLFSCAPTDTTSSLPKSFDEDYYQESEPGIPLEDALLIRRISFDLRGIPPSLEELDRLESNSTTIDALIDEYFQDPLYESQLRSWFSEWLLTRVDTFNVDHRDYRLDSDQAFEFTRSVGEEPIRLMAHIAKQNLPWTEVMTADYSMANELLLEIWPLESLSDTNGWRPARYTDGRPAGGVIMSNGLWWRYYTTPNNFGRTRAMALTDLFLCENYLERPIKFSAPSRLDRESLNEVIRTNPACIGCHSTLDPIAASLFGFWWFDLYDTAEMTSYHPEREQLGRYYLEQEPAWFGIPIDSPAELPQLVAADDRFRTCTVERMASLFWRKQISVHDFDHIQSLEEAFVAGDLRMNALIKAIVLSATYQTGSPANHSENADYNLMTRRLLSAPQIAQTVKVLTGFEWSSDNVDMLEDDIQGYRILLGGFDGIQVTQTARFPSLSRQLTLKRFAQLASDYVVEQERTKPFPERFLFQNIDFENLSASEPEFEETISKLHRIFLSREPDEQRLQVDRQFWSSIESQEDSVQAWKSFISILIRDPAFWSY